MSIELPAQSLLAIEIFNRQADQMSREQAIEFVKLLNSHLVHQRYAFVQMQLHQQNLKK